LSKASFIFGSILIVSWNLSTPQRLTFVAINETQGQREDIYH